MSKWFKKQHRTDADAKLDESNPDRIDPSPIDNDGEQVAPPTERTPAQGHVDGGSRPLKGGYWFIREKYQAEVMEAIARDKEQYEQNKRRIQEEEHWRGRVVQLQGRTTGGIVMERFGAIHLEPQPPQLPLPVPTISQVFNHSDDQS